MEPIIDHIQITVRDMSVAVPFYDKLLPLLGFSPHNKTSAAPPRQYPEYTPPGYYALFFKDLEGIKYEIVTHSEADGRPGSDQYLGPAKNGG
jgi:catechol 2,3-dioxygenase-like lactoylglutathione lyase family enzyme